MNKEKIITKMAKDSGVSIKQATKALNSLFSAIEDSLRKGERVTFVGFGTFSVAKRKARKGRNPRTGAVIQIPAKKVVKFSPSKKLKEAVK